MAMTTAAQCHTEVPGSIRSGKMTNTQKNVPFPRLTWEYTNKNYCTVTWQYKYK